MHKNIPCISLVVVERICKIRVGKSHQLYPLNHYGYRVLQSHYLLISQIEKHTYSCTMEIDGCLIKLFTYVIFCKNCKSHPLQFQRNDLIAVFIDLQSICNPIRNYVYEMIVRATNTSLVKSLKQCFTSNKRIQPIRNTSYYCGFSIS